MCKQMQLVFQVKYKSTNYSAAQSSAYVCRFGVRCVYPVSSSAGTKEGILRKGKFALLYLV